MLSSDNGKNCEKYLRKWCKSWLKKCRFVPIIGQEIHNVEQIVNNYHGIASQFKYSCIKRAQAPATY